MEALGSCVSNRIAHSSFLIVFTWPVGVAARANRHCTRNTLAHRLFARSSHCCVCAERAGAHKAPIHSNFNYYILSGEVIKAEIAPFRELILPCYSLHIFVSHPLRIFAALAFFVLFTGPFLFRQTRSVFAGRAAFCSPLPFSSNCCSRVFVLSDQLSVEILCATTCFRTFIISILSGVALFSCIVFEMVFPRALFAYPAHTHRHSFDIVCIVAFNTHLRQQTCWRGQTIFHFSGRLARENPRIDPDCKICVCVQFHRRMCVKKRNLPTYTHTRTLQTKQMKI